MDKSSEIMTVNMHKSSKITVLHAIRYDGLRLDQNVLVPVLHFDGLDVLKAIDECFTAWYRTEEGTKAWSESCGDYNIGDLLCGSRPSCEFTRSYGFEFLPDNGEEIIEISYDRVLGNHSEEAVENDDLVDEQTLAVEQVCECCGRHFWLLYHEDGAYDYLDDRGDGPCSCEAEFHPVDGSPSLSEWLANLNG